jgi:hypothetical protein
LGVVREAETVAVSHSGTKANSISLQQDTVALSWTSDGVKGKQALVAAESFNRKGRKGDREGRKGNPSPSIVLCDTIDARIAYNSASV